MSEAELVGPEGGASPSVEGGEEASKPSLGIEAAAYPIDMALHEELEGVREEVSKLSRKVDEVSGIAAGFESVAKSLESSLSSLSSEVGRVSGGFKGLSRELDRVVFTAKLVGEWKASTCSHAGSGVCTAWRLGSEVAENLKDLFGGEAVVNADGYWRVNVKVVPHICATCPLYKPLVKR